MRTHSKSVGDHSPRSSILISQYSENVSSGYFSRKLYKCLISPKIKDIISHTNQSCERLSLHTSWDGQNQSQGMTSGGKSVEKDKHSFFYYLF